MERKDKKRILTVSKITFCVAQKLLSRLSLTNLDTPELKILTIKILVSKRFKVSKVNNNFKTKKILILKYLTIFGC